MAEREWDERVKGYFELLRELALAALLILVFASPQFLQDRLKKMGVNKVEGAGVSVDFAEQQKTLSDATQADVVKHAVESARQALTVAAASAQPAEKSTIADAAASLSESETHLATLTTRLKAQVLTQQVSLSESGQAAPKTGWLYLGRTLQDKSGWQKGWPVNVLPVPLREVRAGGSLTVSGTSFIRADGSVGARAAAPVIGVVPDQTKVQIVQVDSDSHAVGGGWFVWAKVTAL